MVAAAGAIVSEVEAMGGMTAAIASGWPKLRIEQCAARQQARIDSGAQTIVGVNKYAAAAAGSSGGGGGSGGSGGGGGERVDVRTIDNSAVLAAQTARLAALRARRDPSTVAAALAALEAGAAASQAPGNNLLALSVDAARARCTLGEISAALEKVFGRHEASSALASGAYASAGGGGEAEELAAVAAAVARFEATAGRRPRILVAKMGQDGHDRGARVMAAGLADAGWDVDISALFQTPAEVAQQAVDADVHVVGVSSQAAGHRALVPALMGELAARGAAPLVVLGGIVPDADHGALHAAGVAAIYGPGTRIPAAALDMLRLLEERKAAR